MIELRVIDDDAQNYELSGYATTWAQPYPVEDRRGKYVESMARGAFNGAVSGTDTVALRTEHSRAAPLASTRGGSLSFSDDDRGLRLAATLPKDETDVRDAVSKIKRGVLTGLSVGMTVHDGGDSWSADRSQRIVRSATLHEVSIVHEPANPAATVTNVRADAAADVIEVRFAPITWVEHRREFSDREREALGKVGKAIWLDGHWAFPTPTRGDYDNAVTALGRTPGKNRVKVRRYLIGRAKAEGWPIPPSWNADGTIGRSAAAVEIELRRLVNGARAPHKVATITTMCCDERELRKLVARAERTR